MEADRKVICKIISNMLDNPGPCDIYPTGKAYDELEAYIESVRNNVMRWAHADICKSLDKGVDPQYKPVLDMIIRHGSGLSK